MIRESKVPGLIFVDELAVAFLSSCGLQKKIELLHQYCKNWNLRCGLNRCKVMVFKKGGKLKITERCGVNGQDIEVVDKFNYLGVSLESTGG
jgi:hypothetical protein